MQLLIVSFIFICLAMIAYTIAYSYIDRYQTEQKEKWTLRYKKTIEAEFENIKSGKEVSFTHLDNLKKELKKVIQLMAYEKALLFHKEKEEGVSELYQTKLASLFNSLSFHYEKRDTEEKAYFAYVVGEFHLSGPQAKKNLVSFMTELTKHESLYCRRNAFRALSMSGNDEGVIRGLKNLSRNKEHVNLKLLTEDLLEIPIRNETFLNEVLFQFPHFSEEIKVVLLNYFSLSGISTPKQVLHIYKNEEDLEVRLACLRFLGKYPSEEAREILLSFIEDYNNPKWEYVSTAAFGLSKYKEEEVALKLKKALRSNQWHVRYNAAYSLASMKNLFPKIATTINEEDKFAREILAYHLKQIDKKEVFS